MDFSPNGLVVKRNISITAIVTALWKEEAQQQLQGQVNQIDGQIQQLDMQAQRTILELQKQSIQPNDPKVLQQIDNIQIQANQQKSQMLEQKNQALQQLQQAQMIDIGQEVNMGQVESYFTLNVGDNLVQKMQVDILIKDGVVQDIRGTI
jgi:hypothetical protein